MGHIKRLLAEKELEPRGITANMVWSDLCENIHLHHRNVRFDFSQVEWAHLRAMMNTCGIAIEQQIESHNYKEGNPNFLVQASYDVPIPTDSAYYPNRFLIEENKDNTFHIHYRDIRIHLSPAEFKTIAQAFTEASKIYEKPKKNLYPDIDAPTLQTVPIDYIQPYDEGHRPGAIDEEHRKGIDIVKGLIKDDHRIRPILITPDGQRKDGFKRYMAQKERGQEHIECIIDPFAEMGGQHGQSFLADD